ncbi:MAG TPA: OmpA family protein [Candidatus Limnocylindrales bacterium]|nr:OmpA family protein [Candidatus Limnocylindrales bacterium]
MKEHDARRDAARADGAADGRRRSASAVRHGDGAWRAAWGAGWAAVVVLVIAGCASGPPTAREHGMATGAILGATSGAIIGQAAGGTAEGALIGGAVGAIAGGAIGDQHDAYHRRNAPLHEDVARRDAEIARNRALIAELRGRSVAVSSDARGVVVTLPDVFFAFDSDRLTPDAVVAIADIGEVLRGPHASGRRIAVEGHTDAVGTRQYNQWLSERRAWAVADELAARGVDRRRLAVRGFGEAFPVEPNVLPDGFDNPRGRARNRRVEVIVLNPPLG